MLGDWHKWYAWHPVYSAADDCWIWLESIERMYDGDCVWRYRLVGR